MDIKIVVTVGEIISNGAWEKFCADKDISICAIDNGAMRLEDEVSINSDEAVKYGFTGNDEWR